MSSDFDLCKWDQTKVCIFSLWNWIAGDDLKISVLCFWSSPALRYSLRDFLAEIPREKMYNGEMKNRYKNNQGCTGWKSLSIHDHSFPAKVIFNLWTNFFFFFFLKSFVFLLRKLLTRWKGYVDFSIDYPVLNFNFNFKVSSITTGEKNS